MNCPRCEHKAFSPPASCPECGFSGPLPQIEELDHIQYLLKELAQWQDISPSAKDRLQARYLRRRQKLEIELELRPPPFSPEEARRAAREVLRQQQLLALFDQWRERGWITPEDAEDLIARMQKRIVGLQARLHESETPPVTAFDRPALLKSLHETIARLQEEGVWVSEVAHQAAVADLDTRVKKLEIELGLRPRPKKPAPPPPKPTPPPHPPREPITWERIRDTLLSKRTLRWLIFVSVFLLFTSAISLVLFNPELPAWMQISLLTMSTLSFYGAGWYVRTKMELPESGIALVATGSLLVPVDFYAIYMAGGIFPREAWAEVWWLASAVCLGAYIVTVMMLRYEFFGYLVGTATGSLLCATLQVIGTPGEWWSPALCGLALVLLVLALWLERKPEGSIARTFGRPFRHLGLLTATSVLLILTGLSIADEAARTALRTPLALDWWLAGAVYTLAAVRYPKRVLASAACFTVAGAFVPTLWPRLRATDTSLAWIALGWALLTPLYLLVGWALQRNLAQAPEDLAKPRQAQGRTITGWGVFLILVATVWAFGDMSATTPTHAVLTGSVALAVLLWRRAGLLPFASLLSFSAVTTWMATLGLDLAQYCLGWAALALLHRLIAVFALPRAARYTPWLYAAEFCVAGLALLPPLVTLERGLTIYALFNWSGLAGWATRLAHGEEHPGLRRLLRLAGPLQRSVLHWATALPLPILFWLVWIHNLRPADGWLGLGFAALAWVLLGLSRWLARYEKAYSLPWHTVSFLCSAIGPIVAGGYGDQPLLASTLLAAAALYFLYTYLFRVRWWLVPGGLTLPFGYVLALDHLGLPLDPLAASLALVPAAYILVGIWLEERRGIENNFLKPLHGVAHVVAAVAFFWGFGGLWNHVLWDIDWTDGARLWAAGGQLLLGVTYGVAAWYLGQETWGHVAAWLGVVAGGLIATAYSQGRGSSAAKAALLAAAYVLAERALYQLRERNTVIREAWPLYHRPLLVAGWAVSGGTVVLALLRNLVLLRGGPVREDWAIVGLLLVVALYALSTRLFRRPLFLWLAAPLLFAPWTILTHRGWYVWGTPPVPNYALAWVAMTWLLLTLGLLLDTVAGKRYGRPLRTTAHVLLPFALLWGMGDAGISSATFGLGVVFYAVSAIADHRRGERGLPAARWLYPAALLTPVWFVYLLAWQGPWLPHAHFGILLLALSPALFVIARLLRRVDPADALPFYLASYGSAIVGTMLVSYEPPLLALALLFDAALALVSARLLCEPLWIYPAAALPPVTLLLALAEADFDFHRRSWWLIGLGTIYLTQAWALRQLSAHRYATPLMAAAYAIVTLALPMSSFDQTAAFWAYGAAALIYAISAFWLREPLFLTPAAALSTVPYAITVDRAAWIEPANYGLVTWPGILVALLIAHLLDHFLGAPRDFPWGLPERWFPEAARRLTEWWGLPFYTMGYVGALMSAGLSAEHPIQLAATLALAAVAYGTATLRFQLRGWLLIAATTAQAAALAAICALAEPLFGLPQVWIDRLGQPAWRALAFLPVTLATAAAGLAIERRRKEGSPFANLSALWEGWSRPLYWLLALDLLAVQIASFSDVHPGTLISVTHAVLIGALAVTWEQSVLTYAAAGLGFLAVIQRLAWVDAPATDGSCALALLALGYGVIGYGLEHARRRERLGLPERLAVLERPLERAGLLISGLAAFLMMVQGAGIWRWLFRALFLGRRLMTVQEVAIVQMAVLTLALLGLLYLAAALVRRLYWLGYGAVALLLCAWSLEWFLVRDLREVQWYAVPAGVYLLGVGYLEWRQGYKVLARWIDHAALLLLLGSSFYQSLAEPYGWPYALLMGAEGLFLIWLGSARRQRRFLYLGVVGVVTAVGGQLVRQLFSVTNAWIALGIPGIVILALVILIERSLETIKRVSPEWLERLEKWE